MFMLILLIMIMGTIITISSNSWLSMWMGMELNLMSFIFLMTFNKSINLTELLMKYWIIQVISSLFFIVIIINMMNNYLNMSMLTLINFSMLMKMGMSPFHYWFPELLENSSWFNSFILMTWQKIAPFWILSTYFFLYQLIFMIILLNLFASILGGWNQTNLQKFFAFSSLNQNSWLISSLIFSKTWWLLYLIMYMMMILPLILFMNKLKIYWMTEMINSKFTNYWTKIIVYFNILSMLGIPPFMGFIPKWFLIYKLMNFNKIISFMMILLTMFIMYFYMNLLFYNMLFIKMKMNFLNKNFMKMKMNLLLLLMPFFWLLI